MSPATIITTCLIVCALPFVIQSCRKKEPPQKQNNIPATNNYFIYFSNCPHPGLALNFEVTNGLPAAIFPSYKWDFGDGATSTESTPSHAYQQIGTYTVKAVSNNNDTFQKTVEVVPYLTSAKTHLLAGPRRFSGTMEGVIPQLNYAFFLHARPVTDTLMELTVINDGSIRFFDYTMYCEKIDTTTKAILFTNCATSRLTYYYEQDSIVYYMFWASGKRSGTVHLNTN